MRERETYARRCHFVTEQLEPRRLMAAGDLDKSFDGDGLATLPSGYTAYDVAVQSDSKTIVVGMITTSNYAFIRRYNVDGSIDVSFGDRGTTILTNMGSAQSVAIQDDGKIIVGGANKGSSDKKYTYVNDFGGTSVARLLTNGAPDKTFDGDGVAAQTSSSTDLFGPAMDIVVEPDYTDDGVYNPKYVTAGTARDNSVFDSPDDDMLLTRWTNAGKRDSAFDGEGLKYIGFGGQEYGRALAIDTNGSLGTNPNYGKITIVGSKGSSGSNYSAALARVNRSGALDASFDSDGKISQPLKGYTKFNALSVIIQPDSKAVVAGQGLGNTSTGNDFALIRVQTNGKLDTTFGTGGQTTRNLGGDDSASTAITSATGGILLGGLAQGSKGGIAAFTANGLPDTTYFAGASSAVISGVPGINGLARTSGLTSNKRFAAAGGSTVSRYLEAGANVVYISTLFDATMAEDPANNNTTASFYVYRTEKLTTSTRVFINAGGSATAIGGPGGTNYDFTGFSNSPISNYVDIPANQTFVLVTLTVANDTRVEGTEYAVFSVLPNANYEVGSPSSTTVTIYDNDASTVNLLADATVRGGTNANTNFGNTTSLEVKHNNNAEYERQVYLKFDLGSVDTINSAKLQLFGSLNNTNATNVSVGVYSASNTSWSETGINYNNKPATSTSALSTATIIDTVGRWYTWDVTNFLKAEKAAGRSVVTLVLKTTIVADPYALFNSDEAATNRPQLVLS